MKEKIFKKGFKKRLFSVVLALAMIVTLMPMNSIEVYAAEEGEICWYCGHDWSEHVGQSNYPEQPTNSDTVAYCKDEQCTQGCSNQTWERCAGEPQWIEIIMNGQAYLYNEKILRIKYGDDLYCDICSSSIGGLMGDTWYPSSSLTTCMEAGHIKEKPTHEHSFTYTLATTTTTNDTIKATCGNSDGNCELAGDKSVSLTLTASSANYSGISGLTDFNAATKLDVKDSDVLFYAVTTEGATTGGTGETSTAPTTDGYYYASLTVGGVTAVKAFTIGTPGGSGSGSTSWTEVNQGGKHFWYESDRISTRNQSSWGVYYTCDVDGDVALYNKNTSSWLNYTKCAHMTETEPDQTPTHTHNWAYSLENNNTTIKATCTPESGTCPDNKTATLTLTASSANYSGSTEYSGASFEDKSAWTSAGLTDPTSSIKYYKATSENGTTGTQEVTALTGLAAGNYYASVTVGTTGNTATAKVPFKINKAEAVVNTAPIPNTELTYSAGTSQALLSNGGVAGTGASKLQYCLTENGTYSDSIPTATAVGEYDVWYKAIANDSGNYKDSTPKKVTAKILGADLEDSTVTAIQYSGTFDGAAHGITVNLSGAAVGGTISYSTTEGGEYSTTPITYTNKGDYTVYYKVTKTGYNPKKGSSTISISRKSLTADDVTITAPNATGSNIINNIAIKDGRVTLVKDTDYTIRGIWAADLTQITEIKESGDYYIDVEFIGNYGGTFATPQKFTVSKKSSSSGGGSYTPPATNATIGGETGSTTNVSVNTSGGQATVSDIPKNTVESIANSNVNGSDIVLDVSKAGNSQVTKVTLTKSTVENISKALDSGDNNKTNLVVKTGNAEVTFDAAAVKAIAEQASAGNIQIVVENTTGANFNNSQKKVVEDLGKGNGEKQVVQTFEASIISGGKKISNFMGGNVTVAQINFTVPTGKKASNFHIYYIPTSGAAEKCVTWVKDGRIYFVTGHFSDYVIVYDETVTNGEGIPVYRLYNHKIGDHLFTTSAAERDMAQKIGYKLEGIGFYASGTGKKVYRLYNRNSGEHFYTASEKERDICKQHGWNLEGVAFTTEGEKKVYRLYNGRVHFYTSSEKEKDFCLAHGWRLEGIGFNAN